MRSARCACAATCRSTTHLEETRQRLEEALWYLGRIRPLPAPQFPQLSSRTDWSQAWKEHYHPIPIGERLIIVPAWLEIARTRAHPDPHRPGHGLWHRHPPHHAAVPGAARRQPGAGRSARYGYRRRRLRVGNSSIAALKLGALQVVAVDIDPLE